MNKIAFFEVQEWEIDFLRKNFPTSIITNKKLMSENVAQFVENDIISTFLYSDLNEKVLGNFQNLVLIASRSTGIDHIDQNYCTKNEIKIANVPEYGSSTVAEHTFALILALTRKIYPSIKRVKDMEFSHSGLTGVDIEGKTLGLVGLGKIGKKMLSIAHGFSMNVLAFNRSEDESLVSLPNFKYAPLDFVLQNADIISLHLPLTPETRHIISDKNINNFKMGAFLVNTARGALIQTECLLDGLSSGRLAGVGLDVLEEEEELDEEITLLTRDSLKGIELKNLLYDHILMTHPKVVITPHNAFNSREALQRILEVTAKNINDFTQSQ